MKKLILHIIISLIPLLIVSQSKLEFDGQASFISSFSPQVEKEYFSGLRYIPKLSYKYQLDTFKRIDFEASANVNGLVNFHNFEEGISEANLNPYRFWIRYTGEQFEIRAGLQKIEFGSAMLLRPLQWFNQIDPRDPLQLTNGVYGVMGRYYFLNNANIWVWGLYGNEKTRGFDLVETNRTRPEFGGRLQYPVPKGELALSYHYRTADSREQIFLPPYELIPENRIGIDGKWDVGVGLWFEVAQIWKLEDLGSFTNQTIGNIGVDYTFGLGNGLNVISEHLFFRSDNDFFGTENTANISAITMNYPLGFFDNISSVMFYSWETEDFTFFLNYSHQFKHIYAYVMAYYNPETQIGIQRNELVYNFTGPGVRIMLVYNH